VLRGEYPEVAERPKSFEQDPILSPKCAHKVWLALTSRLSDAFSRGRHSKPLIVQENLSLVDGKKVQALIISGRAARGAQLLERQQADIQLLPGNVRFRG
jgi:hypothetical protein